MNPIRGPGTEPRRAAPPATLGGPAWQPRTDCHAAEVADGRLWRHCGTRSETATLRQVLLTWPGEELLFTEPPDRLLMLARPDLDQLRRQAEALAAFYGEQGVAVHFARPSRPPPPNFLFLRDLFFMTPEGAVLARTASGQRAGEERFAAEALSALGVPILLTPRGNILFEGADALWLDPQTVLVGVGRRTNRAGCGLLAGLLADLGVRVLEIQVPKGVQHLLGLVNFIAPDLAAVRADLAPPPLRQALTSHGIEMVELGPGADLDHAWALNFVALAPRRVVLPAGCPNTLERLRRVGVEVFEIDVGEYIKASGGLGCLTGILHREDPPAGEVE